MFTNFTRLGHRTPVLLSYQFPGGHIFHDLSNGLTRVRRRGPKMLPSPRDATETAHMGG